MNIQTLQDWNARLQYCGCCLMPYCPEPLLLGRTVTFEAGLVRKLGPFPEPEGDFDLSLWKVAKKRTRTRTGVYAYDHSSDTPPETVEHHIAADYSWVGTEEHSANRYELSGFGDGPCYFQDAVYTKVCSGEALRTETYRRTFNGILVQGLDSETTSISVGGEPDPSTDPPNDYPYCSFLGQDSRTEYDAATGTWETEVLPERVDDFPNVGGVPWDAQTDDSVYAGVVRWSAWLAAADAAARAFPATAPAPCWSGGFFESRFFLQPPTEYSGGGLVSYLLGRFYFRIHPDHKGSKFFITYDVAEYPDVGDPFFLSQDNVIEWTGPGTGDQFDPSWSTPEIVLDPPTIPGSRTLVNIRYTCYSGRYGVKPQVMGIALEIPPP